MNNLDKNIHKKAEFNAITKGEDWNYNTGEYIVICTDGKLAKNGNEI